MLIDNYPLLGLRLTTPRLELRLPSDEELGELAALSTQGIHDPAKTPFLVPWTDLAPAERARSVIRYHWTCRSGATPDNWSLLFAVFRDGVVVGQQDLRANDFAIVRTVSTGSWLGRAHQGQGIGTEMRAAVLHLAFAGLDSQEAESDAYTYNGASLAVSRKLGYEPDGISRRAVRGQVAVVRRLRLTRARWEQLRTVPVTIEGLEPCLPELGCQGSSSQKP